MTGFVDFALSCFEDPHVGFAKYWTYDWYPYNRHGLVERYLARRGVSHQEFAVRVGVRCLWTLQRGLPVAGHDAEFGAYRGRILALLRDAVGEMR